MSCFPDWNWLGRCESQWIHRVLPKLHFFPLFQYCSVSVSFSYLFLLHFFSFIVSYSPLPYICRSFPIFPFLYFNQRFPTFVSLSFPPFLSQHEAANDYQMVVIQHFKQRKWWLASSRACLALCECVWPKSVFHLCSCRPAPSCRLLPVVVLSFFSKVIFCPSVSLSLMSDTWQDA